MILIRPIITEKSISETAAKKYTFKVSPGATKTEIAKAVGEQFGVKVLAVKTVTVHGKDYRTGKKWMMKKKSDWKKAIVTIQPDKQIDLFEVPKEAK